MNQFINSLPRQLLVFLIVAGGILFFMVTDPPHTLCDGEVEGFEGKQQGFLTIPPKRKKFEKTTRYERLMTQCKISNNPGGCYELFHQLKGFLHDAKVVSLDCQSDLGELKIFKGVMGASVELMARLAWGEKPPVNFNVKFGWLDSADVALFCRLKAQFIESYGHEKWASYQEKIMSSLPGAEKLNRKDLWERSLVSTNCSQYN